jgi:hypothetical protein
MPKEKEISQALKEQHLNEPIVNLKNQLYNFSILFEGITVS